MVDTVLSSLIYPVTKRSTTTMDESMVGRFTNAIAAASRSMARTEANTPDYTQIPRGISPAKALEAATAKRAVTRAMQSYKTASPLPRRLVALSKIPIKSPHPTARIAQLRRQMPPKMVAIDTSPDISNTEQRTEQRMTSNSAPAADRRSASRDSSRRKSVENQPSLYARRERSKIKSASSLAKAQHLARQKFIANAKRKINEESARAKSKSPIMQQQRFDSSNRTESSLLRQQKRTRKSTTRLETNSERMSPEAGWKHVRATLSALNYVFEAGSCDFGGANQLPKSSGTFRSKSAYLTRLSLPTNQDDVRAVKALQPLTALNHETLCPFLGVCPVFGKGVGDRPHFVAAWELDSTATSLASAFESPDDIVRRAKMR